MVPAKNIQTILALALVPLFLSMVSTMRVYGHGGDALEAAWTDEIPRIDGSISEGEWKGDAINIPTETHVRNYDASISISAMNDEKNLYLNMQVFPPEEIGVDAYRYELVAFYIDSNHDGVLNQDTDLAFSLYSAKEYWSSNGATVYRLGAYEGDHTSGLMHQFGWTGTGWVYEAMIPFTLDNGYTWAKPGDELGFATDWVTYEDHAQALNFFGLEEIVVPPDSVSAFGASQATLWDVKKTVNPAKFMDISLVPSGSEPESSTENNVDTGESSSTQETDQTATVDQSAAGLGPYLAIGIAIAGGAVAGAIALTRKNSAKTTAQ